MGRGSNRCGAAELHAGTFTLQDGAKNVSGGIAAAETNAAARTE
jgi:X-X-X-Leu-X-X-Gly heptad repeat protein